MKYDDCTWHSERGNGLTQVAPEAVTHIGFFFAWVAARGLTSAFHIEESGPQLAALAARRMTGPAFLIDCCDGQLTDEDLNDEGNAFVAQYYEARYLDDCLHVFRPADADLYALADTWENADRLVPVLDQRLAEWRARAASRPWWKLWG